MTIELYGKKTKFNDQMEVVGAEDIVCTVEEAKEQQELSIWWNAWRDRKHGKGWRPLSKKLFMELMED